MIRLSQSVGAVVAGKARMVAMVAMFCPFAFGRDLKLSKLYPTESMFSPKNPSSWAATGTGPGFNACGEGPPKHNDTRARESSRSCIQPGDATCIYVHIQSYIYIYTYILYIYIYISMYIYTYKSSCNISSIWNDICWEYMSFFEAPELRMKPSAFSLPLTGKNNPVETQCKVRWARAMVAGKPRFVVMKHLSHPFSRDLSTLFLRQAFKQDRIPHMGVP